jgi:3'(2'), 5'-bisphosphate nucleotidase
MTDASAFDFSELIPAVVAASQNAGAAIMEIYKSGPEVRYKEDKSPVTDADQASEDIILEFLSRAAPEIPVIAEEQAASGRLPAIDKLFFLIDPLDGTKEFLKQNGEFTINIALVDGAIPIFGLVFAPDKSDCYVTLTPKNAVRFPLCPSRSPSPWRDLEFEPLTGERAKGRPLTAIVSRSHLRPEAQAFLEGMPQAERMVMGSSLKFGVLARGDADVYPRFGPTSEWDTAAGHALLNATGGCVLAESGKTLRYGKRERKFANPGFVAWRSAQEARALASQS